MTTCLVASSLGLDAKGGGKQRKRLGGVTPDLALKLRHTSLQRPPQRRHGNPRSQPFQPNCTSRAAAPRRRSIPVEQRDKKRGTWGGGSYPLVSLARRGAPAARCQVSSVSRSTGSATQTRRAPPLVVPVVGPDLALGTKRAGHPDAPTLSRTW